MNVLVWIASGIGAGWLTRLALKAQGYGLIGDLTLGMLGALVGGAIFRELGVVAPDHIVAQVFIAVVGGAALLTAVRTLLAVARSRIGQRSGLAQSAQMIEHLLEQQLKGLEDLERRTLRRLVRRAGVPENPNETFDAQLTLGQRVADRVASFGGSWTFIGLFFVFMMAWMALNNEMAAPFDPFPYILLNLALSCLAALQAPIIMMSQNRQTAKDRVEAQHDYEVNLRAEMEIMTLHAKIDEAREQEWRRLAVLHERQAEALEELAAEVRRFSAGR